MNLGCATGHPSFVMSNSSPTRCWPKWPSGPRPDKYPLGVHMLPKQLDEEVARLHLEKLGVKLTQAHGQAGRVLEIPVSGPFKPDYYRY